HEQGPDGAVAHQGVAEDVVVGAEHDPPPGAAEADQLAVVDAGVPAGVVAGRPEPAGQPAQHGVAGEPGRLTHDQSSTRRTRPVSGYAGASRHAICPEGDPVLLRARRASEPIYGPTERGTNGSDPVADPGAAVAERPARLAAQPQLGLRPQRRAGAADRRPAAADPAGAGALVVRAGPRPHRAGGPVSPRPAGNGLPC